MSNADAAWVDVLPSLEKFVPGLKKALGGAMPKAGQEAGQEYSRGFTQSAVSGVEKASAQLAAARKKEADAAGALRVAEAKLQDLRDSGKAKTAQLVAAEENLAKAKRTLDVQNDQVATSTRRVSEAQEAAAKNARGLDDGMGRANRSGGLLHGTMVRLGGAFAAVGVVRMFGGFVEDAQESARIGRLTEQVIKSTGGAAKVTAEQVGDLATSISNKTAVDDEAIQSASNLLLTFTKVRNEAGAGNDIFNQATQAAVDMSVAMGTDANGAAKQLGKALNDPIKGVSALGKAGVQFTAQQKEQIKTLVESGDVLGAQKIILGEMQTQFGGAAGAAADPLQRLKVIAGNLGESVGGFLLPAVSGFASFVSDRLIPGVKGLFDLLVRGDFTSAFAEAFGVAEDSAFVDFLFRVREVGVAVFGEVRGAVTAFVNAWRYNDGEITSSGLPGFMERLGFWFRQAFDFVKDTVVPALAEMGRWVQRNSSLLLPLVAGLGAAVAVFKVVAAVTKVWAAAQAVLNVVMAANPIVLIIAAIVALAAGLVVAYRQSETFRKIVDGAFRAVAAAGQWLWQTVLKPVFGFILAYWQAVATGIGWAWTNLIQPAWSALSAYVGWMWNNVLSPYLGFIISLWQTVATGILWAWTNLIQPAWSALTAYVDWMWNNVLSPILGLIGAAWSALGSGMRLVYDNVIAPIFGFFGSVLGVLRDSFQTAVSFIGSVWDTLKDVLMAPVQFVVDVVWNNGLRKLWNWINNLWGGDDIDPFAMGDGRGPNLAGAAAKYGTGSMATGGVLPGHTPGRDVHRFWSPTGGRLDLSGGEAVMRPEFTRVLGTANIELLNQIARQEGEAGLARALSGGGLGREQMQHFAGGGIVQVPGWLDTALRITPWRDDVHRVVDRINGGGTGGGSWGSMLVGLIRTTAGKIWDKASSLFGGGDEPAAAGGQPGGGTLGGTWQSIFNAVKAVIPQARVNSSYRAGDPGYHGRNKAVDFGFGTGPGGAGSAGLASIKRLLYDRFGVNLAELIYNGVGNDRSNLKNGRALAYSAAIQAQHKNHVHAAVYDDGGLLPPGWLGLNTGSGVERVLTPEQDNYFRRFVDTASGTASEPRVVVQHDTLVQTTGDPYALARAVDARNRKRERQVLGVG